MFKFYWVKSWAVLRWVMVKETQARVTDNQV